MTARMVYTRWHRDRGGKLVLRQTVLRIYPQRSRLDRAVELACDAAAVVLWFVLLLVIAANSTGCASADGYDSSPESASPEAHALFSSSAHGWCCDAFDADGKRYLECGHATLPPEHADEVGNRCYCHGVVSGDECEDNTAWMPGSFCTQSLLVCWEAE